MVAVNGEEIRQVVLNLVLNAEQALLASGRGGTIKVRTWAADAAAFVEVSDDGPGIPPEAAGRALFAGAEQGPAQAALVVQGA